MIGKLNQQACLLHFTSCVSQPSSPLHAGSSHGLGLVITPRVTAIASYVLLTAGVAALNASFSSVSRVASSPPSSEDAATNK